MFEHIPVVVQSLVVAVLATVVISYFDHNSNSNHAHFCRFKGRNWYKCGENPLLIMMFFLIARFAFWLVEG
jgi:hypothetical protein